MRVFFIIASALFSWSAVAADITVKVVDPHSAAVAGAQVQLFAANDGRILAIQTTSAEGTATLQTTFTGPTQIKVLAPGFAAETISTSNSELTVTLRLATAAETVVVTGTRTLVAGEAAGADVDTLTGPQLIAMHPVAAADALRFLPGTIVNAAGQRGGLTSLFVRGGESRYNKVIVDGVTINEPGGTFDFGTLPMDQADRMEFVRGAQSTLYGSDAMTSVMQMWTRSDSRTALRR